MDVYVSILSWPSELGFNVKETKCMKIKDNKKVYFYVFVCCISLRFPLFR